MYLINAFPCILLVIWGLDTVQGPVCVSKLGIIYAYHWGKLFPYQVVSFVYAILLVKYCVIICTNLILPIRLVDHPPHFFWYLLDIITNMANTIVNRLPP